MTRRARYERTYELAEPLGGVAYANSRRVDAYTFKYDVRDQRAVLPVRLHRPAADREKFAELAPIPYRIEGALVVFEKHRRFVARLEPVPTRVGKRSVVTVGKGIKQTMVHWRCDCGREGRAPIGKWRQSTGEGCRACGREAVRREHTLSLGLAGRRAEALTTPLPRWVAP